MSKQQQQQKQSNGKFKVTNPALKMYIGNDGQIGYGAWYRVHDGKFESKEAAQRRNERFHRIRNEQSMKAINSRNRVKNPFASGGDDDDEPSNAYLTDNSWATEDYEF